MALKFVSDLNHFANDKDEVWKARNRGEELQRKQFSFAHIDTLDALTSSSNSCTKPKLILRKDMSKRKHSDKDMIESNFEEMTKRSV